MNLGVHLAPVLILWRANEITLSLIISIKKTQNPNNLTKVEKGWLLLLYIDKYLGAFYKIIVT